MYGIPFQQKVSLKIMMGQRYSFNITVKSLILIGLHFAQCKLHEIGLEHFHNIAFSRCPH